MTNNNLTAPSNSLAGRGAGNDTLIGGGSTNILVGGEGDDLLIGGNGRDILIGGIGSDVLKAGKGDDILIAGNTDYDANDVALHSILAEWNSTRDYMTRVNNILNGSGSTNRLNGNYFFNATDVHDDGVKDTETGGKGRDWFFANIDGDHGAKVDKITDKAGNEIVTDINFV